MVSRGGKDLLANTIKSLTYQNKIREEKEMWKQREKEREFDRSEPKRKKYEDSDYCDHRTKRKRNDSPQYRIDYKGAPNCWMKKLAEEEDKDPNRWGHSGFKELYPEEFESSDTSPDSEFSKKDEEKVLIKKKKHKKHKKKLKKKSKKSKKSKKKKD